MEQKEFTCFVCPACKTEIEASLDMVGETAECPACSARLVIPAPENDRKQNSEDSKDGIVRHGPGDASSRQNRAQKNRTIRIELGDL